MKICLIFLFLFAHAYCNEESEEKGPSYSTPLPSGEVYFAEPFDSDDSIESWVHSKAKKDGVDSEISKYDGKWKVKALSENALDGDTGLVLEEKARHHAISAPLDRPYKFEGKSFVLQYEVNFQTGIECGGAYVKLLSQTDGLELESFQDKTGYTIMFGPDKCGEDYKLHFIFRHKNPITGEYEEKHANNKPTGVDLKKYYSDKATHLYTLVVEPDNSFQILIDQILINSGSLLSDMNPSVNPPKEIVDVEDKKPEDWDERETIADPEASKPEDWDEEAPAKIVDTDAEMPDGWLEEEGAYVDDEDAVMPEDWDEEMDGEWEAPQVDNPLCKSAPGCGPWEPPLIANPQYKGKWSAPRIPNPAYKGIWKPRMISNPGYFEDNNPYAMTTIGAVGFELWSMSEDIYFDNIVIADDKSVVDDYADKTWKLKQIFKTSNEPGVVTNLLSATEDKPWLWVIYVFVVALPVVLIFVFCCKKSKKEDPKKTDEPTPDDPHDSNNEEEEENNEEVEEEEKAKTDEDTNDSDQAKDGEGDGDMVKITKADLEKENEEAEEAAEDLSEDVAQTRKSPRKRKPRVQE